MVSQYFDGNYLAGVWKSKMLEVGKKCVAAERQKMMREDGEKKSENVRLHDRRQSTRIYGFLRNGYPTVQQPI